MTVSKLDALAAEMREAQELVEREKIRALLENEVWKGAAAGELAEYAGVPLRVAEAELEERGLVADKDPGEDEARAVRSEAMEGDPRPRMRTALLDALDALDEPERRPWDILARLRRDVGELVAPDRSPFRSWAAMRDLGEWLDVEPPPRRWLLQRDQVGVLPRGVVGMLVAPGGRGKTMALVQLAVALATGGRWLGTFQPSSPGRVVLALAEEDLEEMRRRLFVCARDLGDEERRLAAENIVPLGLAGEQVGLVQHEQGGAVVPSAVHEELVARLSVSEHVAVILDPLSRWAPGVEGDNAGATAAVQALEQLTKSPGLPTVLIAHHNSKWARREGNKAESAGARGVTALFDGVRWEAKLLGETERDLAFAITKNNYAPATEPVELVRGAGGYLRPPSSFEVDQRRVEAAALADKLKGAVLEVVREQPGCGARALRDVVRERVKGCRLQAVDAAVRELLSDGLLEDRGSSSRRSYHLTDGGGDD